MAFARRGRWVGAEGTVFPRALGQAARGLVVSTAGAFGCSAHRRKGAHLGLHVNEDRPRCVALAAGPLGVACVRLAAPAAAAAGRAATARLPEKHRRPFRILNERVEEAASQLVAALADLQGDHGHTRPWRELSADLDAFCASAWAGASCMQPF